MKKWTYLVAYMIVTENFQFIMQVGKELISGDQVWAYFNSLGQQGWELVNVVERIGNMPYLGSQIGNAASVFGAMMMGQPTTTVQATTYRPATVGYFYHFKKETSPETSPLQTPK